MFPYKTAFKKDRNPLKKALKKDRNPFEKALNKDRNPFEKALNKDGFPLRDGNPSTMLPVLISDAPGRHQSPESTIIKFYFSKRDEASR